MMELGWPLPKRRKYLKDVSAEKTSKTHPVPFQGKMQYFGIHSVPLGLPLYRLENGRTTDRQAEYLADHPDLSTEFFRTDTESAAAQKAQHQLLTKLSRERKNLFREFEKHPQTEPIILSSLGYVVNGNRRLSTWRELYDSNPKKFKHFNTIEVIILPHADDREIDRVEAALQIQEDLKADYSWTSMALMMREKLVRHGYSEDELAAIYGKEKKSLREMFDSLDYAIQYLESRDTPNKFSDVDGKEYAFIQMCRARKKIKGSEGDKELFEKSAFCLADEAGEGKRIYSEIPKIVEHIGKVRESLASELEIDADGLSVDDVTFRVSEALDDENNFEPARLVIRDTIEAASTEKKEKRKKDYVYTLVRRARDALSEANNSIDKQSSRKGIPEALDQIEDLIPKIRSWAVQDDDSK